MANINKIRVSGTTYDIQDTNAALASDVFITAENRNSIQSRISEGVYSLATDDIYTITGTKSNPTDKIEGTLIINATSYYFSGNTSGSVYTVPDIGGKALFNLGTEFSITTSDRDALHISEIFLESFDASGEKVQMNDIVITHNPTIGVNKIDYVSSLYTEFLHEKYALSSELDSKQDTLISGTNIKTVNNQSLLGSGDITIQGGGSSVIEVTQAQYDALSQAGTLDLTALYIITDASGGDLANYYTKTETDTLLNAKQATLVSGTNIKTINNESILGSGNIDIQGGSDINVVQTTGTSTTDVMSQNAVTTQLSDYVYTADNGKQDIYGSKTFIGEKKINFTQGTSSDKLGFTLYGVRDAEGKSSELGTFEFRPNTFTIDGVQHPLMYFGHYRNTSTASAVPQTVIGFRQYDQSNAAAYHYLLPLPKKAKIPFSLTTSFKDYYAPIGFKNGSTMITADNTGVVDLSSEFSSKVDTSTYNTLSGIVTAHTADTTIHVTAQDKTNWDNKSNFSGDYNDLTNKPTIPTVPTNVSDFTNDAGYITSSALDGYATTATTSALNNTLTAHTVDTTIHVTSANKTSWDGAATNASNAVTALGGMSLVKLSQSEYDSLSTKDNSTLYVIVN